MLCYGLLAVVSVTAIDDGPAFLAHLPEALELRLQSQNAESGVTIDAAANTASTMLPIFLRSFNSSATTIALPASMPRWLAGLDHYRLLPGAFPDGMHFHFDGLATVLKFSIADDGRSISYFTRPFESPAALDYKKCIFFGTGTGPTLGEHVCFTNPGVNLLPIEGQLWLTIDTSRWGRVDPHTLETLPYHSHSPCVTPNFVVSKLDDFVARSDGLFKNGGMLKYLHQGEDGVWMVMDRHTRESRIMSSGETRFVNNHFWNCYEEADGAVVVEAVAATEDYLDTYFEYKLAKGAVWDTIFHPSIRCRIPTNGTEISCTRLMKGEDEELFFDYPTFNPLFKMRPSYQFFYAIAPQDRNSRWFDRAIKVDAKAGRVVKSWSSPGIYMNEFDFVPHTNSTEAADEDDGVLLTVLYNVTSDKSFFGVFDAKELTPLGLFEMAAVVPFHAHGIVCRNNEPCFTNP